MRRGALAGMAAAATWAALEPPLGRLLKTPYNDVRLLGAPVTTGRLWPAAGLALHLGNGAAFGAVFERLGGRGVRQALLAAELENLVLYPGIAAADRLHPDRRSGAWPKLFGNKRVLAYEIATHAVFGAVLGYLLPEED